MFSISLETVEVNDFSQEAEAFVETLNGLLSRLGGEGCESIASAETCISQVLSECGRKLLEQYARHSEVSSCDAPVRVSCLECGGVGLRRYRRRCRRFQTLCGEIRVKRWVYVCDHGHYQTPWEATAGFKAGCTVGVAEVMCRLASRLNYRTAAEELSHHGIHVSHTTLHKKVRKWAAGEEVSAWGEADRLEPSARWYVSCDGIQTPSLEGWNEVKTGLVCRTYPQPAGASASGARPKSLRYVATRAAAPDFGEQWTKLATQSGIYAEDTVEAEVVVIGDGAAWIWNLADQHFPGAVEIVDYMHAKSHLYDAAKSVFGEEATETVRAWVEATEPFLYAGETPEVVARLRALGIATPEVQESLEREVGYFEKHASRMQYKTFVENGYHIGSGLIESACKHVVAERCKQAGMRWTQEGINAILFYRCLWKNGTWDSFWKAQRTQAA